MAGEHRVRIIDRMNYFDGLFLRSPEFILEQAFHVMTRRYLNYLLFNAGVLYTDTAEPLQVSEVPSNSTSITISPGAALIRDETNPLQPQAHEVHINSAVTLDLADTEFVLSDGDVYVTLGFDEKPTTSGTGGGTGVLVTGDDLLEEQAVIHLSNDAQGPVGPVVRLATLLYDSSAPSVTVSSDNRVRGGLRYEILSQDFIDRLGTGPSPGSETLLTIAITPAGPVGVDVGTSVQLTATGHFDSGPRPLTANDGLSWESDTPGVAAVDPDGVVSGVTEGSANITASAALGAGGSEIIGNVIMDVVVPTPQDVLISEFSPVDVVPGQDVFEICGFNIRAPNLSPPASAAGTIVRFVDHNNITTILAETTNVMVLDNLGDGTQCIRVTIPNASEFSTAPSGATLEVLVQVEFDGVVGISEDRLNIFFP